MASIPSEQIAPVTPPISVVLAMRSPLQTFAIDCEDAANSQDIVCDTQIDPMISDNAILQALNPSTERQPLAFRPFRNIRTTRADPYSSSKTNGANSKK